MDVKKMLLDRRQSVEAEAGTIAERAANENRNFSPTEQGEWDALYAELQKIDERLQAVAATEARGKEIDDRLESLSRTPGSVPAQRSASRPGESQDIDAELRSFLRGEAGAPRAYTAPPSGNSIRSLSKLTAGAGGNTVPTTFYDEIVQNLIETSAILQAGVRIINTAGGETIQIPKVTGHSTAAIVAEAATIGTSDPVFSQASLGAFKYGVLVQVSRELLDDTGFDLQGYLAEETGRALGNALGAHLVVGSGTNQPRGITQDSSLGVTTATAVAGVPTADEILNLQYSVTTPYRNRGVYLMKDTSVATIRKFKDASGAYVWGEGINGGANPTLWGKPVFLDPFMPAMGLNSKSIIFGDLSRYFVRLAGGVRFERSDEFAFNADLVTFRALLRADGALIDTSGAVKHLVGAAT
jgi:HK97 family phage major capsid protein